MLLELFWLLILIVDEFMLVVLLVDYIVLCEGVIFLVSELEVLVVINEWVSVFYEG